MATVKANEHLGANWSAHNRRRGKGKGNGKGYFVRSGDGGRDRVLRGFKADSTTETDFKCNLLFRLHSVRSVGYYHVHDPNPRGHLTDYLTLKGK